MSENRDGRAGDGDAVATGPAGLSVKAVIAEQPAATRGFARIMDWRIGIVPVPVFVAVLVILVLHIRLGEVPADLTTNILTLAIGGFACAEVGKHIPGLRRVGAPAILATFVPSYLVYVGAIPAPLKASIDTFTEQSNFLYLFIGSIIVGSILGMDRRMLVGGFVKIFVPLLTGSIAAAAVGLMVGTALGLGFNHTLFMIVVPVMAGGVGEGAIPLSIGYAALGGGPHGHLLAEILPAVMFGSLTAVLIAGGLNMYGKRRPDLTGNGQLQIGEQDVTLSGPAAVDTHPTMETVAGAVVLAMTLYGVGAVVQHLSGFPGPVTMLFLTVVLKVAQLVSPRLEQGAFRNYQFFRTAVTYPLLFAIGVSKTPWEKLMAAFNLPTIVTIIATVMTLIATGFFVGRLMRLHPIDAAIVNACHSGQGGTGDVAILSAADRMSLMPFAQVATRIGGAITVTIALALFSRMGM